MSYRGPGYRGSGGDWRNDRSSSRGSWNSNRGGNRGMGMGMGSGYQGSMGGGMGGMGPSSMHIDQANLNNLMGTLLNNLERNIMQRQGMVGGYRDRLPMPGRFDRDRRDRGPLRGVDKRDRGGIRRDRVPTRVTPRDRDTTRKTTTSRDSKTRTDKDKRSDSKRKEDKKDEKKKDEKDEESKKESEGGDDSEKGDDADHKKEGSSEAYCTVCEKFFTGDLLDHRRSVDHKAEKVRKFPSGQRRCDVCKIRHFRTQQALWNHLRSTLHRRNTTRAVNLKKEDKANGELMTVDSVGYSDDEDGSKKRRSKRSSAHEDEKDAKKAKPEHSKEVMEALAVIPKDDPNPVVAMDHVVPMTGYYCKVCHKFYHNEVMAKVTHCRSKPHSAKYEEGIKNGTIKPPLTEDEKSEEKAEKKEEDEGKEKKEDESEEKAECEDKFGEDKMEEREEEEEEEEEEDENRENEEPKQDESQENEPTEEEEQDEIDEEVEEVTQDDEDKTEETTEATEKEADKDLDILVINENGDEGGDMETGAEDSQDTSPEDEEEERPEGEQDEEEETKKKPPPASAKKNMAKRGGKAARGRKKAN